MKEFLSFMINHRRELHKIPELGYNEFKTSAYVQKVLKSLGYKFETVGTGIIVNIKGTNPKKTIGFRADMDALPIQELNEIDYKSRHKGIMHACGHDGHMAILLGFAKYLSTNPPLNNVVLVFQPAEELFGLGAKQMVDSGRIKADVFYAVHVETSYDVGKFDIKKLAGGQEFQIEFIGKGRHACLHDGKDDAILAAAKFINEMEPLNKKGEFIFHIGKINGGEAPTAVADKVTIQGTMRYFDLKHSDHAHKEMNRVAAEIEKFGIGKVIIKHGEKQYPPTIPTPSEVEKISKLDGCNGVVETFGSEDFSCFIEKFTGAIMYIGARTKENYPIHNSKFNFDENAMGFGVGLFKDLLELSQGETK